MSGLLSKIMISDDAVVQEFKDSFSFIFIVSKPILFKETLETCKNKPDKLVLIAIFL